MSMSKRSTILFAALVLVLALCLPAGAALGPAYADEGSDAVSTEESADAGSEDAEDEESSSDEEGNELSTEGSTNTGVTEYNAEGQEVTSDVTDDSDVLAAQIFLGVVAALAVIGFIYLVQWLVRVYRPRRAVQRAAAEAAVTPVPADEPLGDALPDEESAAGKED